MRPSNPASTIAAPQNRSVSDNRLLALIAGGHGTTHWYAGMLSVALPLIAKDLGLSFAQVGLIMTCRALLGASGNVATSIAADLGGRRKGMLVGSVIAVALCYVGLGLVSEFFLVVLFTSLAFMASNAWHPPAMSLLGERFPKRRGYALGWHGTGSNLGQALSPLILGTVLTVLPWRQTLMVNVLPALVMAALLMWGLPAVDSDRLTRKAGAYWGQLRSGLIQNPALLKVGILSVLRMIGQQCLQTFLPLYLAYELKFSTTLVGVGLMLMTLPGSMIEPFNGMLSDRIGRRPVLFTCLFLSAIAGWGLTQVSGVLTPILLVGFVGLLHFSLRSVLFAFAMDVTPAEIGASTVGFIFTINHIFSALAPVLIGYLADLYGLRIAFYAFTGLTLLAAFWVPLTPRSAGQTTHD